MWWFSLSLHSNSCMLAQTQVLSRCLCTAAVCTVKLVPSAVWLEIRTAPGTDTPAHATCQTQTVQLQTHWLLHGFVHTHCIMESKILWPHSKFKIETFLLLVSDYWTPLYCTVRHEEYVMLRLFNMFVCMCIDVCRRFRRQDVRNGDPNALCSGGNTAEPLLDSRGSHFSVLTTA